MGFISFFKEILEFRYIFIILNRPNLHFLVLKIKHNLFGSISMVLLK